tara:strand:+ start:120 stop:647 length:528 start_codon:yes stop_codon:yes gene_type:complete
MNFHPFPVIETERLILRKITLEDWPLISYLRSDKTVNQFVKRPNADTQEKAVEFIERTLASINEKELIYWSISLADDPKMIGSICIWNFSEDKKTGEVGYDLDPKFHKLGIMNEALQAVIKFGFSELSLDKIEAYTQENNENSKNMLLRNNFIWNESKIDEGNLMNIIFELKKAL